MTPTPPTPSAERKAREIVDSLVEDAHLGCCSGDYCEESAIPQENFELKATEIITRALSESEAEIGRLKRDLERAGEALNGKTISYRDQSELIAAQSSRIERLEGALKEYGRHTQDICGTWTTLANGSSFYEGCQCGLDAALSPERGEGERWASI